MYLLATDYDRTLYINETDFRKNLSKILKFKKYNLFVIATGRSYYDYITKTNGVIPCDYLIINHGATILKDNKIIKNIYIDEKDIELIKKIIDFNNNEYFVCSKKESRLKIDAENISKINVTFKDNLIARKTVNYINENLSGVKAFLLNHKNQMEIVSKKANKKLALDYIAKKEKIENCDVYTVGDGYSDLEMIEAYNGYAMKESVSEVKKIAKKELNSVGELLEFLTVYKTYTSDKEEILNFINDSYNYKKYFEYNMAKIYDKKVVIPHLVIRNDNDIIAMALLKENKLKLSEDVNILTIGSVCVNKKYRSKGYLNLLMNEISKEEKKYDLCVLSGDKDLYDRYGYYPNLKRLYTIYGADLGYEFKRLNSEYNLENCNLYNNKSIHFKRDITDFDKIAIQGRSEAYDIFKNNIHVGYIIYSSKFDCINEVSPINKNIISNFVYFKDRNHLNLRVLNNDYELQELLETDNNSIYNRILFKIIDIKKIIKLSLEYKLKYNSLKEGTYKIKIDDLVYKITVDKKVSVTTSKKLDYDLELDNKKAMEILLNKKLMHDEILASWFPLDIDIYNNDLI